MNINDLKYQSLSTVTGLEGAIEDLEFFWLNSMTGEPTIADGWYTYLTTLGFSGSVEDMQYQWTGSLGYTGTLNDRMYQLWANGLPSGVNIADVFSIDLYTGNGSTQKITTGLDLVANDGLVWIKNRSIAWDASLHDTIRGSSYYLESSTSGSSQLDGSRLQNFQTDGYGVGSSANTNQNGQNMVGWSFVKAPKFFDVIEYSGDGVSGREIPHGLEAQAGMAIVKMTNSSGLWYTQHISRGGSYYVSLNSAAAESFNGATWNYTAMTDTAVTLGNGTGLNGVGNTYVMYVFAHDDSEDGVIQCGQYTGNGLANGPTVTLGWKPQYVMIKCANKIENWHIMDSARGFSATGSPSPTLEPNNASSEVADVWVEVTETGFKIVSSSGGVNLNGNPYIFMAIREASNGQTN